ncbi:YfhO family protein [bacterium]|nr:YfhO family protein [bacterium]
MTNHRPSPVLWLSLILAAPFLPGLLLPGGRVFGDAACDGPAFFYFIDEFAGRCWREGIIPLWNPHVMMGLPFLGEGQAALFHPLSWLFIALPTGLATNLLVTLCFVSTGLFFYGWLRALKLGKPASFCCALVWCYSSVLIGRIYAGHLTILLQMPEIPLILMLWERYHQDRKPIRLAGISLAYALMITASFPQGLYIFSLFFMLYVLIHAAAASASRAALLREIRAVLMLAVFIALGVGIGAVQLLPSADFVAQSARQRPSYEFSSTFSFPPENLLTLLVPRFFGCEPEQGPGAYWGYGNYWEMSVYIGLLPLALVVPGLMAAPRRRRVALASCAAIFLVLALGSYTPLFPFIYHYVPFFDTFRGASKNMLVTELCLVTLASFGLDGILNEWGRSRRLLKVATIAAGAMLLAIIGTSLFLIPGAIAAGSRWQALLHRGIGAAQMVPLEDMRDMLAFSTAELAHAAILAAMALIVLALAWRIRTPRAFLALIMLAAMADLLGVFMPMMRMYPESLVALPKPLVEPLSVSPYPVRILAPGRFADMVMHHGLCSASGVMGNTLARYNNFANRVLGLPLKTPQTWDPFVQVSPAMNILAIDWVILPSPLVKPAQQASVRARAEDLSLIRIAESCPRAWLAAAPIAVSDEFKALEHVMTRGNDTLRNPVIEHTAAGITAAPLGPDEYAKIVGFSANRVELEINARQPRVLVLSEMYEKNWTAKIGGKQAAVFPANYLLRGVEVPAGRSQVIFEYRPAPFRIGAVISLASLALLLGIAAFALRRRSPQTPLF